MADTAVVAKPLVAPTPEKGKKKKSSGKEKSSKKKEKKEEATKDAMELEQPAHKPKRKFDEHTSSADKGKQKAADVDEGKSSGSSKHRRLHIEVAECSGPVRPSLAIFPNGPPPLDKLHNEEDGIKFGLWENTSGIRTKKMMVAETDKMLYLGQPTFRDPFKYFIMTVDKSTSTAKMIPVADFFHMQQQIKGYTPQLSSADDVERSYLEQRLDLIERFGSKKKKTQVHSARANKINADAVSNAEEVMATISEKATQKAEAEVTSELYPELPPYNKTASEPDGVYPLNDIIPHELRQEINFSFIVDAIDDYTKRSVIERKYGAYIAQRTKALGEVPLGEQERQARLLTVIAALVKLRSFLANARRAFGMAEAKSATDNLLPEALLQHFLPLFASAETARRFHKSPLGETRLTSYIIVLLLHSAQDWTVQVAGVSELLGLPPKDAQKYIVSVGCRVHKAAPDTPVAAEDKLKAKRYVLVAPLVLPSKAQRSSKKKGK